VVIKTALKDRLDKGHLSIRPLLDEIPEPPCIVLKYLDNNVLNTSNTKQLEKSDIKFVARKIMETLNSLHEAGFVHTGTFMVGYSRPEADTFTNYRDCRRQAGQHFGQL
jgi:hypothetical protein